MALRAAALAAGLAAASGAKFELTMFDAGQYPLARCNDGSPAGYYWKPSATGSSTWIVFQEGGGWCFDAKSCSERPSSLTSSKGWPASADFDGILDATDPRLGDANVAYLAYCTSDAWVGGASDAGFGFPFSMTGRNYVTAVFSELVKTHGLGSAPGTRVLYTGCSAGGRGALFNLEYVQSLLATQLLATPSNMVAYGGLLDSAFWMDIDPVPGAPGPAFAAQAASVYAIANVSAPGYLNPACTAAQAPGNEWHCLMGQWAVAYLTQPYLLHAYLNDEYQLTGDLGIPFAQWPNTSAQLAFAAGFSNATKAAAAADTIAPARPGTAALLPACFKHCNTQSSTFSAAVTLAADGQGWTLQNATTAWFFGLGQGQAPGTVQAGAAAYAGPFVVEQCKGFNCGNDCPQPPAA